MKSSFLSEKINKLKEIYREEGFKAAAVYIVIYFLAKTGWFREKRFLGRLVEMRGNRVRMDGCIFCLDTPLISTEYKSLFIRGSYEKEEREAVRRFLDHSLPVVELGGAIGVVACVTNKRLADPKAHVVVEANPDVIPILKMHRDLNGCSFTIINKALSYGSKQVVFYKQEKLASSGLHRATDMPISVPTVTLEEIFTEHKFKRANLICDIEGGEVDLVIHEKEFISKNVFQIIFELHPSIVGKEAIDGMLEELRAVGFRKIRTGRYCSVVMLQNHNIASLPK